MGQQVKDPALLQMWLRLQLQLRLFYPWSRNFCMLWMKPKKKVRKDVRKEGWI